MASILFVSSLLLAPLASQGSGAAVTGGLVPVQLDAASPVESSGSRPTCLSARRALRFYRSRMAAALRATGAPVPRLSWPPDRGACAYVRWLVERARDRAQAARLALERWRHEYAWWRWLPARWKAIIRCETGSNFRYSNRTHQGAFGFAIASWDAFKLPGYPEEAWQATPREQYEVALAIARRYGWNLAGSWGCA